ncbi:MAG: nuclear transport factor 2 family protein [Ottowia sp.]|uniref:nuclear transport factor 2 family protein n=1 Tax=Ottowia sp. TaxID=1898956 RepID=UPI003C70FB01
MLSHRFQSAFIAAALLVGGAFSASAVQAQQRDVAKEEANRQLVVNFYDRFFNKHEMEAADVIVESYKQHNPYVPDGKAPFVNFFKDTFQKNPQSRAKVVRSAADGDLVYLHVHSQRSPEQRGAAVVDIFRVQDGKIVEHWDVVQPVPEKSANGNTMF